MAVEPPDQESPSLAALSLDPATSPFQSPTHTAIPPHRSHSPTNNLKRSDPFQFGSRYLLPEDDPFEFNAWDHVETTPEFRAYASAQYAFQRTHAVTPFDASRFNTAPEKWWDKFYRSHTANFFKDRKWLKQEFPVLEELTKAPPHLGEEEEEEEERGGGKQARILEVGAGAGNTAFPILRANENPGLFIHACDFSKRAVELIQSNPAYDPLHMRASVWDIASAASPLPPGVEAGSIDVVLLIFIFSALSPSQWRQATSNIWRALKPGGEVCFRDYGRGDLAQVRFKKGRWLEENFYVRGDGTRVYFFEEEELRVIWGGGLGGEGVEENEVVEEVQVVDGAREAHGSGDDDDDESTANQITNENASHDSRPPAPAPGSGFEIVTLGVDRRLLINRQKQLKMHRCWMQGKFRKPSTPSTLNQKPSAHSTLHLFDSSSNTAPST